jgi:hypothetical protein
VNWRSREEAAQRAGIEPAQLDRLVALGIVTPAEPGRFSPGDVRRALMAKSLEDAEIPLDHVAAALERCAVSLAFLDAAAYERFAALGDETFRQVSDRTGVPLELLTSVRGYTRLTQGNVGTRRPRTWPRPPRGWCSEGPCGTAASPSSGSATV